MSGSSLSPTLAVLTPSQAWADVATHTLRFVSVKDRETGCFIQAEMAHRAGKSVPLTVSLVYPAGSRPEPEAEIELAFPAKEKAGSSSASAYEPSRSCRSIRVSKIEAHCPDSAGGCRRFVSIRVPDVPELGLRARKIEAR